MIKLLTLVNIWPRLTEEVCSLSHGNSGKLQDQPGIYSLHLYAYRLMSTGMRATAKNTFLRMPERKKGEKKTTIWSPSSGILASSGKQSVMAVFSRTASWGVRAACGNSEGCLWQSLSVVSVRDELGLQHGERRGALQTPGNLWWCILSRYELFSSAQSLRTRSCRD